MWRCDTPGKCSDGNGACYSSFNGNGGRRPNIVCENLGEVHRPGLWLDPESLRSVGHQRHGDLWGAWDFLF